MLLIFFLVTSSMDTDKGLPRQLPPPEDSTLVEEVHVKDRNVLELQLDAHDRLTCNGEPATYAELALRVAEFVDNASHSAALPEKSQREVNLLGLTEVSDRHVISVQIDRKTTYNAYFKMQNAIVKGYYHLRNQLAKLRFGRSYVQCSQEQRDAIALVYPQRISEQLPTEEKGGVE